MKPVKNTLSKSETASIPHSVTERRLFLKKRLEKFKNKLVVCPAIGAKVKIESKSITEIAENASLSTESTIAALHLDKLIRNSDFDFFDMPDSNTQKKKFQAVFMIHLKAKMDKVGNVKILVAATEHRGALYYSVTVPPTNEKSGKV